MRYVLDASVGLKGVLAEPDADKARRLRDDSRAKVHGLIAPDSFALECAHGLAKLERRGLVADARKLWADLMVDAPQLFPTLPLTDRAMEIAAAAQIGVYDCLYVALAEREGCDLLTADDRLVRALQPTFPFLTSLASLP
jgi:predicted nucleic acid-binding protein